MRNGNEKKSSSSSSSMLDCDVGLGLKMQVQPSTESYSSSCKRATMALPYYNYPTSGSNAILTSFSGDSGGPTLNQVAGGGGDDIYDAGGDGAVLPMTFHNSGFRPSGGVYGKAPFTVSQWQELERQRIIHKYMMASIHVPPQLLLPAAVSNTSLAPVSQSHSSGLELRVPTSTGSDPEPWRCKRTDGKKWRCSRDVAPDQKYCERHAHKGKARSRKLVEQQVSSHKSYTPTNNKLQRPTSLFPTMAASATTTAPYDNDQTRSIEWFMRGGGANDSTTVSQQQQQWQQLFQTQSSATTLDFTRDNNTEHRNKNVSSVYNQQTYEDPYIPDTNFNNNSFLDLNDDKTTRHFIDAWENEYIDGINHKSKKFSPSSSLSLSMCSSNGMDEENGYLGIGMMGNSNSISWMNNSLPGGPLGEALCLGNASNTNSNSNTNSSSCSKSSCEDGSHALNFIG